MHVGSIQYRLLAVLVVGISCSIIACGGGGGGSSSTNNAAPAVAASSGPAAPVIASPSALAGGETSTASVAGESGVTYTWSIQNGTLTSSNQGTSVTFRASSVDPLTLTVTASNGTSTRSAQSIVRVQTQAPTPPAIVAPTAAPAGATGLSASITPESGTTLTWTIQGGTLTSPATGASVTFNTGGSGTLTLTCIATNRVGNSTGQAVVQVQAGAPAVPVISAPTTVAAGQTGVAASVSPLSGVTYQWNVQNGTLTGGQGTPSIAFTAGVAGTPLQVTCTVTNASSLSSSSQATATVTAGAAVPIGVYGTGIGVDSLANTRIGGPTGSVASVRFRARHTGTITGIRAYFIWDTSPSDNGGYSGGTGGTLKCAVQTDDGTSNHFPSGTTLGYGLHPSPIGNLFPVVTFTTPVSVTAGTLYHLVYTNVDPTPSVNYASVNCVHARVALSPRQPAFPDTDWAMLVGGSTDGGTTPDGTWSIRGFTEGTSNFPILELQFGDGWKEGRSYMEVWVNWPKTIGGTQAVRQTFTPPAATKVDRMSVRLVLTSGTGDLQVRLEKADGTLVEQGTIAATSIPTAAPGWVTWSLSTPRTLAAGTAYNLVFTSSAGTVYTIYPIRQGSDYAFDGRTYFAEGYAQYNDGTGWRGWYLRGVDDCRDGDLQFYFRVVQ
jgi:hypothetical protein